MTSDETIHVAEHVNRPASTSSLAMSRPLSLLQLSDRVTNHTSGIFDGCRSATESCLAIQQRFSLPLHRPSCAASEDAILLAAPCRDAPNSVQIVQVSKVDTNVQQVVAQFGSSLSVGCRSRSGCLHHCKAGGARIFAQLHCSKWFTYTCPLMCCSKRTKVRDVQWYKESGLMVLLARESGMAAHLRCSSPLRLVLAARKPSVTPTNSVSLPRYSRPYCSGRYRHRAPRGALCGHEGTGTWSLPGSAAAHRRSGAGPAVARAGTCCSHHQQRHALRRVAKAFAHMPGLLDRRRKKIAVLSI